MKHFILGIAICLTLGQLSAQNTPIKITPQMDSTFYALGILMHGNLNEQFGTINLIKMTSENRQITKNCLLHSFGYWYCVLLLIIAYWLQLAA